MDSVISTMQSDGLLNAESASRVRTLMAEGKSLEEAILGADGVKEEAMLKSLAKQFDLTYIDLEKNPPSKEFLSKFPVRVLMRHHVLPLEEKNGVTYVASARVSDTSALDELRLMCGGKEFALVLAQATEIERVLNQVLGLGADTIQSLDAERGIQVLDEEKGNELDLNDAAQDATIIRFVNQVLIEAVDMRTTDVHIEPFEDQLRLRYRIDGELVEINVPPSVRRFHAAIVSRIKILSHLDIAEKRLPQDGRIKLKLTGREIDVRVSIIPMIHGEAVVMRLLMRTDTILGVKHLGMVERDARYFDKVLDMPHGIVLVTGPTGSGKTTTLYAALSSINTMDRKIITIEDPVEYQLKGINQIQVNHKAGLTFAAGLRAILRHDPDVVLIGEIRDMETAEIAVQASLTGHLVFSTLHTNDAPSAATRLIDMGLEPYLVASSLETVLAQRLVRLICKECKVEVPQADVDKVREEFGDIVPKKLYKGTGCRNCSNTGYRGRQGIFEMMPISDEIRSLVLHRQPSHDLRKVATKQGMSSLREDGWRFVHEGRTTVEEIMRNTKDEAAGAAFAKVDEEMAATATTPAEVG